LRGHAVHAVCGRAYEYLFRSGCAESADKGIDSFIRAEADEKVVRREWFRGVDVYVAIVAEILFKVYLVASSLN
jgi:hypothetical protein